MKNFQPLSLLLLFIPLLGNCQVPPTVVPGPSSALERPVGGGCDGCKLMYAGMPDSISSVDTSSGFGGPGQQLLIEGTVYRLDGKTPAPGVILYYWQTDHTGLYRAKEGGDERVKRHGDLRGWVKTGRNGEYAIYTVRPAPYPNTDNPAHVHISLKEPAILNEYYIDDILFEDDPLVTKSVREGLEQRGGNGIVKVSGDHRLQRVRRNIVLGMNIPNYP
ncbi:MAG TPA: hypothetical protein VM843_03455 [Flavisolibacter sp.]|jgi:protocatechuate 3,4-dioxygenase beta subunit|nr:hypothetical protein [Flavisolibacter sp.]